MDLRRFEDAARAYARVIIDSLDDGRTFSAAFYIREMAELGLAEELYIRALAEAVEEDDLWWQMRALQDLGWESALQQFFEHNAERIEASDNETFKALLAEAQGHRLNAIEHRKAAVTKGEQPYWSEATAENDGSDTTDD